MFSTKDFVHNYTLLFIIMLYMRGVLNTMYAHVCHSNMHGRLPNVDGRFFSEGFAAATCSNSPVVSM